MLWYLDPDALLFCPVLLLRVSPHVGGRRSGATPRVRLAAAATFSSPRIG